MLLLSNVVVVSKAKEETATRRTKLSLRVPSNSTSFWCAASITLSPTVASTAISSPVFSTKTTRIVFFFFSFVSDASLPSPRYGSFDDDDENAKLDRAESMCHVDGGTKHVAGGEMHTAVLRGEAKRLRALPRALTAQDAHAKRAHFKKPS